MIDVLFAQRGRSYAINAENPTGEKGRGGRASSTLGPSRKGSPCLRDLPPGSKTVLADIRGCGMIHHIWMTVDNKTSDADCFVLRDLVLKMYWDNETSPSVEVPIGDFFCCGFGQECFINSAAIIVAPSRGLNCYFTMPFRERARIEIENQHRNAIQAFFYQIDFCMYDKLPDNTEYFHAQWRREKATVLRQDYTIVDSVKGRGRYVGTYVALSTLQRYWWGEGEVKFYIDNDVEFPTICGTGMEDYFGGSWSFAVQKNGKTVEQNYNSLYVGYPFYSKHDVTKNQYYNDDCPPMRGFYRWHIPDPIFFEENLKVTVQQIGVRSSGLFERQDDLSSVAYWYQLEPHNVFSPLLEAKERWPR